MNIDFLRAVEKARTCERNDPCWCGSGEKFKKCHLDRHREERVDNARINDQFATIFAWRTCLYNGVTTDPCSGDIINAHTIQKSRALKKIVDSKQEVLTFYFQNIFQTTKEMPRPINWRRASVFTGFCRHHDGNLFAPLESQPFTRTAEQIFLGSYRALGHEYFLKTCAVESARTLRKVADRGRSLEDQVWLQHQLGGHELGMSDGLKDLAHWKRKFDEISRRRDFEKIASLVIEMSGTFCAAVSCATSPNFDFQGNKIQDFLDRNTVTEHACFSIEPKDASFDIVVAWPKECAKMDQFVDSILKIDKKILPSVLVQFFVRYSENIFFSKAWWAGLSEEQKTVLREDGDDFGAYTGFRPYKEIQLVDWNYKGHLLNK